MAKKIMVQGTMSNAGKSLLAAGLCRVFYQDGYRVAPFKSQNMALNSFITEDGLEMGRAQVMQAEAAGIKPEVAMNPILLKPTNDVGSQVIVNGEVLGTMPAMEYYRRKKELIPEILKAFDKLEREYDIIVIEGAGSPAEINLKADDIVNMGMAKMAKAPVLLVGDIDRGGVFAQLVGTMMLLEDEEKRYVKGLVINKFRGDRKILEPGLEMLYDRVQVPIAGVMPYVRLDIDDEDSLTERFRKKGSIGAVDIAVIRLPRISNFTDFNALECMDSVSVRYVERVSELGDPDIIMIPGTKNTIGDLKWLRESGLEARVKQHAAAGKIVFGICGGYQMLGETIRDRYGVEERGEIAGIGLLPIVTEFEEEKTRTRVQGAFGHLSGALAGLSGVPFEGYEIHMGTSTRLAGATSMSELTYRKTPAQTEGEAPAREHREDGTEPVKACKEDGACAGNVYGTYVHGIFDLDGVAGGVVSAVLEQKGMSTETVKNFSRSEYKEHQYDLLADAVRANLDMEMIYRIMEEGI